MDEGALHHSSAVGYGGNSSNPMLEENPVIQPRLTRELHLSVVPRKLQVILEKWPHPCQNFQRASGREEDKIEVPDRALQLMFAVSPNLMFCNHRLIIVLYIVFFKPPEPVLQTRGGYMETSHRGYQFVSR